MSQKNVVIIGLGAAGVGVATALAGSLPSSHRIVALNEKPYAYHTIGSLRGATTPGWEKQIPVKLDRLFKDPRHIVLGGYKVVSISKNSVTLDKDAKDFGREIPFDVLVVATGSTYAFPSRPPTEAETLADVEKALQGMQADIKSASSILVLGGGAVGVEFAGEVKAAHPQKKVTLVHSHDRLHSSLFKPALHESLMQQLGKLGVDVHLNTRPNVDLDKSGKIAPRTFDLGNGKSVEADFVLIATGTKPNGNVLAKLDPSLVDENGQVKIKDTLQVDSNNPAYARIFSLGDVTNGPDMKLSYTASLQAPVVAKNVVAIIGAAPLKPYTPMSGVMGVVTLGPDGGASQLPPFGGLVVGPWISKMIKSKGLFVSKFRSSYNY